MPKLPILPVDGERSFNVLVAAPSALTGRSVLIFVILETIATREVIGSSVAAVISAYTVHVGIIPSENDAASR